MSALIQPGGSQLSNVSAEQKLLGAILANNKAFDRISEFLAPEHFADPLHGQIFSAIKRRCDAGQLADAVTLHAEFKTGDTFAGVGGTPYLAQLLSAAVGQANVADYGRIIADLWHRRVLIELAHDPASTPDQIRQKLEIFAAASSTSRRSSSLIDPVSLQGFSAPDRKWIVSEWLPAGHVTINYGNGGVGKTLLAQQLMTACATSTPWCGLAVTPCRSLALFCEDDEDELWRRQEAINRQAGVDFRDLGDMRWQSGVGDDNLLMTFDGSGRGLLTPRLHKLIEDAEKHEARLLVIDTAADVFGGNENDRSQVRQFVGRALGGIARQIKGAVLLNAHPSRSGMGATGDMDGGSTGWSNTARSRWSVVRPPADGDEPAGSDERILTKRKANYSSIGDEIRLRWQDGVLVPVQGAGGIIGTIQRRSAEDTFLTLLDRCADQGVRVSASAHSPNYAPKIFAKRPDAEGCRKQDFDRAMSSLFAQKAIAMQEYGRKGDARQCIARVVPDEGTEGTP